MQLPADLRMVNAGVIGAGANVAKQGVILGAPGAGLRYRLWFMDVAPNNTAQAVTNWNFDVTDNPLTTGFGRAAGGGFYSDHVYWPGGLPWAANDDVGYQLVSTFPAAGFGITLGYTIEAVS